MNKTPRTKVYFDTEFTGLHQETTLISIGLVAENGQMFYAEFTDYDMTQIDDWLIENVMSGLSGDEGKPVPFVVEDMLHSVRGTTIVVRDALEQWLSKIGPCQMISDCLAYDWVLFCGMWGGAMKVPGIIHYIPLDLSTMLHDNGFNPDVSREEFAFYNQPDPHDKVKHHALWDAIVIKKCHEKLMETAECKR